MILSLACDTILIISQEALFCYPHRFRLLHSPQHSWGIRLFIQDPKHKASKREKDYAIKRLDGLIRKIETAMEKVVIRITKQLKQPEKKKAVVEEIKKEVKPSIRERLAQNVAKIQREEAERKQLNKGKSCSSDLEL